MTAALVLEHTHRVRAALLAASALITTHDLPVLAITAAAGTRQPQPNGVTLLVGDPVVTITTGPAGFLRWAEVLDVAQVLLCRTNGAITTSTGDLPFDGRRWTVRAAFPRAASLRDDDDLPGGRIPWQHGHVRIGLTRLRAGLTARGLA